MYTVNLPYINLSVVTKNIASDEGFKKKRLKHKQTKKITKYKPKKDKFL